MRTLLQWKNLFDQVNKDCFQAGLEEVPYSNVEYYAEQILNLEENLTKQQAMSIAKDLSQL
jgi:hypothetical protein